jgi:heme oxygenase
MPSETDTHNSVMLRLRTETREAHDRIESVPFSELMLQGRLPQGRFAGQMACWLAVHCVLEDAVRTSNSTACKAVWVEGMARTSHLRHDLACHGEVDLPAPAAVAAMDTVAWIASLSESDPEALLGCLYVLEGSKLGGTILRGCLDKAYNCGPDALSYFWASGKSPMPDFKAFKERMEAALTTDDQRDRVVVAASGLFNKLTDVLAGLLEDLDTTTGELIRNASATPDGVCPFGHG